MGFKEYLEEGRNKWDIFSIKKGNVKWTFRNEETNKRFFIKITPNKELESLQSFLKAIEATPPTFPKTKGVIDFMQMATDLVAGNLTKLFI